MRRAVFPATFDPIHYGHVDIAERAAKVFDELFVAIYVHSPKKLLFTPEERTQLVSEALRHIPNVRVSLYTGLTVDYMRQIGATVMVRGLRVFSDFELEFRMALANRRLAPEVEVVNFIAGEAYLHLSSSTVREIASLGGDVSTFVPPNVVQALRGRFAELKQNGTTPKYMISLQD